VDRPGCLGAGNGNVGGRIGPGRPDRLVTRRRRRLDRGREKRGGLVGPSPVNRGFPSTKYHLAVDANGWPLQVRIGPGNENERAHLLPLIDAISLAGYRPHSVWADRGYCSNPLREQLEQRGITAQISRRRRAGDPLTDDQQPRHPKARGRKHLIRTRDPNARHRWVVERTNAWLRRFKRLTIRNEPNHRTYLAYLTLALILILARAL
jgi:IS5 family transposase